MLGNERYRIRSNRHQSICYAGHDYSVGDEGLATSSVRRPAAGDAPALAARATARSCARVLRLARRASRHRLNESSGLSASESISAKKGIVAPTRLGSAF